MDTISLLRQQLSTVHEWLEGTMADVSHEQAHWSPPGRANPIGASYAHVIVTEDMVVNGLLKGSAPLAAERWADKTGLSEPMPGHGPEWEQYADWTRKVQIDLGALREYAGAVYANSDAYLSTLTPEDLDRPIDLSAAGLGKTNVGWVVSSLLIGHAHDLMGEISCLKGLQGARGYPF